MTTNRLVTVLSALALFACLAQQAIAEDVLQRFVGKWGCSFTTPTSVLGPLAGISQFTLESTGRAEGLEVIASAHPHVVLQATLTGNFLPQDDGTLIAELTASFPNQDDQVGQAHCVGMDREDGQFREMHCVDISDEPGETLNTLNLIICKRQ
jgi:hypothetical protein